MPRTLAQTLAAERDGPYCLWSLYGSGTPSLVPATDAHHLAHRRPGGDQPQLVILLGHDVHMRHHMALGPTTGELLDLMRALYGWDLRLEFPAFFGGY